MHIKITKASINLTTPQKNAHLILGGALILLPFIQLGFNFYVSIQLIVLLLIISFISSEDLMRNLIYGSWLSLLMTMPIFFELTSDYEHELLLVARLYLGLVIVVTFLQQRKNITYFNENIAKIITTICVSLFVFTLVQQQAFSHGVLLVIPQELFIANGDTVQTQLDIDWGARVSATFGEPSYLSFIALTLYVIVLTNFTSSKVKTINLLALWAIIFLSSSLAGLISFTVITLIYLKNRVDFKSFIYIAIPIIILIINIGPLLLSENIIDRIIQNTNLDIDDSTSGRILHAFELVQYAFEYSPIGLTTEQLINHVGENIYIGSDNGILLMFAHFGVTAFFIFGWFFYHVKFRSNQILGIYMFMACIFNGSVFSIDKVAVIGLVVLFQTNKTLVLASRRSL